MRRFEQSWRWLEQYCPLHGIPLPTEKAPAANEGQVQSPKVCQPLSYPTTDEPEEIDRGIEAERWMFDFDRGQAAGGVL